MIYLDNGATTFPKPAGVINSVGNTLRNYGANPGRGGHRLAMKASELLYDARKNVADFFGVEDSSNVIFTLNCTTSLNMVIKGILKKGDHVIISSYEHNAALRPLEKLKEKGITYSVAEVFEKDNEKTLASFREQIRPNTRLLVCTYASNVFGIKVPVERICALCHQYGILTCVDAAQAAGIVPIDLSDSSIDYLCIAGHKGLYGPMGTGALIVNCDTIPDTFIEGGTGSNSASSEQPEILPDRFESGTGNLSGVVGMSNGVNFVRSRGQLNLYNREMQLIQRAYKALSKLDKVILYTEYPDMDYYVPVLSFNIKDMDSETVSQILSSRFNIATRAGLHCAPLAHTTKGTLDIGTVRVVPSAFTTLNDINSLISAVCNIK